MTKKVYTQDWFDRCIPLWSNILSKFKDKPNLRFLEIGSYEGRSTCWLLDNILTDPSSSIDCIDLFEGCLQRGPWSEELYKTVDISKAHKSFLNNTKEYGNKVKLIVDCSQEVLRKLPLVPLYDFIYIDGSHIASDVLEDGVLSFPLLKNGGIFVFDDYEWRMFDNDLRHPRRAIDAFIEIYSYKIEVLHVGRQAIIRKRKNWDIRNEA